MAFHVTKICSNCPFRRSEGAVRLTLARVREIAGGMLDSQGAFFGCHKTTGVMTEDEIRPISEQLHCLGALVFMEKNQTATQIVRVMERIGSYDARAVLADPDADDIFDDLEEMEATSFERRR